MIRFTFRFIGMMLLAGAFVALLYDGTRTIAGNAVSLTPLAYIWNNLHANSLQGLQTIVERTAPVLWDPLLRSIVAAPAWLVLGVLGVVFMLLGRKKKPMIGYARG